MKILQSTMFSLLAASVVTADEKTKFAVAEPTPTTTPPLTLAPVAGTSGWYAEAAVFGGIANHDIATSPYASAPMPEKVDMIGADLTVGYHFDDQNAVQLRFGYGWGRDVNSSSSEVNFLDKNSMVVHTFTLMPGYRYTYEMNESWSIYGAAHVGIANQSLKFETEAIELFNRFHHERDHNSDWGFAYSVEVGVRYDITSSMYTFLAYEFRGSDTKSTIKSVWHNDDVQSNTQTYHVIRIGMGIQF